MLPARQSDSAKIGRAEEFSSQLKDFDLGPVC